MPLIGFQLNFYKEFSIYIRKFELNIPKVRKNLKWTLNDPREFPYVRF